MIHKFKNCLGITLWRWNNFQIELWFCPPKTYIPSHKHSCIDSEIFPLKGHAIFTRETETVFSELIKFFTINHNQSHSFGVFDKWFIFLNFEKWTSKPTSASVDFQPSN